MRDQSVVDSIVAVVLRRPLAIGRVWEFGIAWCISIPEEENGRLSYSVFCTAADRQDI